MAIMFEHYTKRQPNTLRFPHHVPEKYIGRIYWPQKITNKKKTPSKDRTARHHHDNKAEKMEMAWACYQEMH